MFLGKMLNDVTDEDLRSGSMTIELPDGLNGHMTGFNGRTIDYQAEMIDGVVNFNYTKHGEFCKVFFCSQNHNPKNKSTKHFLNNIF
jgi:hypothetical protein